MMLLPLGNELSDPRARFPQAPESSCVFRPHLLRCGQRCKEILCEAAPSFPWAQAGAQSHFQCAQRVAGCNRRKTHNKEVGTNLSQRRDAPLDFALTQPGRQTVERARHHFRETERSLQAMVDDDALFEPIGSNALGASPFADL